MILGLIFKIYSQKSLRNTEKYILQVNFILNRHIFLEELFYFFFFKFDLNKLLILCFEFQFNVFCILLLKMTETPKVTC